MNSLKVFAFICILLLTLTPNLYAQEWRWEADHSFLNPRINVEVRGIFPSYGPTALYDLDNNGVLELVSPRGNGFIVFEQSGEFPEITWSLTQDNCFEDVGIDFNGFFPSNFVMGNLDGDDFPEIIVYEVARPMGVPPELRVYHNQGGENDPDWVRRDELLTDLIGNLNEEEFVIPSFCDWDGDEDQDLLIAYERVHRYELNGENGMDSLGVVFQNIQCSMGFEIADFNNDNLFDVVTSSIGMMAPDYSEIFLNLGNEDEEEWSEPYTLNQYRMEHPIPIDINGDGRMDLMNGGRFILNTNEDELQQMWERPSYLVVRLDKFSTAWDFDGDGELELLKGTDLSSGAGQLIRLDLLSQTERGWQDMNTLNIELVSDVMNWKEYDNTTIADIFNNGNICLVSSFRDPWTDPPTHGILTFEYILDDEGWRFEEHSDYFDSVLNPDISFQAPSFVDLDGDGDQDLAMLEGMHSDSLHAVFYEYQLNEGEPSWELRENWGADLGGLFLRALEFGDFDGDRDNDIVTLRLVLDNQTVPVLIQNVGNREQPEWTVVHHAFENEGPEFARRLLTWDVNGDGLDDILTENVCYLNRTPSSICTKFLTVTEFGLSAFPNPFNSKSRITYSLNQESFIKMTAHDLLGRQIQELHRGYSPAGRSDIIWESKSLSSGQYLIRLKSGYKERFCRIMLIK